MKIEVKYIPDDITHYCVHGKFDGLVNGVWAPECARCQNEADLQEER